MKSIIKTYHYQNSEIQKVQIVTLDNWDDLEFVVPSFSKAAFDHQCMIYGKYTVPKAPIFFGDLVMFHVPDDYDLPFKTNIADKNRAAKLYLTHNYHKKEAQDLLNDLKNKGYFHYIKGKRPFNHSLMAYSNQLGYLSQTNGYHFLVNASFFTFDTFDCDSKYDIHGSSLGLTIKNGNILSPPLYNREALLVDNNDKVIIKNLGLNDIKISISGDIYERPTHRYAKKTKKYNVIVINNRIIDINQKKYNKIPSSGFVISTNQENININDEVKYSGLENIKFGIQVGNSIIIDDKPTTKFKSYFYHIKRIFNISCPPTLYPLDFDKTRAPRMALGVDQNNKPNVIWFEGPSKLKYKIGDDSCGATLNEMAKILQDLKVKNAINLDGGGSAQILIDYQKSLRVSDRNDLDEETERPVPLGLGIKNI